MREKIAEMILNCDDVKEKHCKLLKDLNTQHSALENRKICAECRATAILALIASEQAPLRKALKEAQKELKYYKAMDGLVDINNITTDIVYKAFFLSMLKDNLGHGADKEINELIKECEG